MHVALRGREVGVPGQVLNRSGCRAPHREMRAERVPQFVRSFPASLPAALHDGRSSPWDSSVPAPDGANRAHMDRNGRLHRRVARSVHRFGPALNADGSSTDAIGVPMACACCT